MANSEEKEVLVTWTMHRAKGAVQLSSYFIETSCQKSLRPNHLTWYHWARSICFGQSTDRWSALGNPVFFSYKPEYEIQAKKPTVQLFLQTVYWSPVIVRPASNVCNPHLLTPPQAHSWVIYLSCQSSWLHDRPFPLCFFHSRPQTTTFNQTRWLRTRWG